MTSKTLYYNFCKEHIEDFPYITEEDFYSIENCIETQNYYSHFSILHTINYKFRNLVFEYFEEEDDYRDSCAKIVIKIEGKYIQITIIYEINNNYFDTKIIEEISVYEVIPVEKTIIEYIIKE